MSHSLTAADISHDALVAEERRVVQLEATVAALRAQYLAQQQEAEAARCGLEWRRILRRIEDDALLRDTVAKLRDVISEYEASFREPAEFDKGSGVEYTATDDYADFVSVDQTVDAVLDRAHAELTEAGNVDRAVLMLLICSTEVGKVLERAALQKEAGVLGVPLGEIEDCRDGLVSEWQRLFYDVDSVNADAAAQLGTGELKDVDAAKRWLRVVSNHLGAPFDSVPTA